jgi:hypothetical protein
MNQNLLVTQIQRHPWIRDFLDGIVSLQCLAEEEPQRGCVIADGADTLFLPRSGCRKFLLVDDDIFLPENICRNELSWDSVGVHKAQAVQEALSLIAAGIDVDVRVHRLAGQESSLRAASVLKAVSACDIIIDASAKPGVFTLLAAVAKTNRRPMCWGEVFAGGIGGLIARANPDSGPNPLAVRNGILSHLATLRLRPT